MHSILLSPVFFVVVFAAIAVRTSAAETGHRLPLWEAGAGGAALALPDYRGAEQGRGYLLPLPYFVYRGELLRADREGLRAVVVDTQRVELDLSLGATAPVNSEDNRARAGMPDLLPTVEAGAVLKVHLGWPGASERRDLELDFRLPLRQAIAWGGGGPRRVGTLAFPQLNLDRRVDFAGARWNLGLVFGAYVADRRYHEYFYGVPPAYATANRPAYAARGGFGGWQTIGAASATYGRTWVGAFVKADWLHGAVFEDSPLLRRRFNAAVGAGVTHTFARSERTVSVSR